jgi:flagellar L-ring protein FlgH
MLNKLILIISILILSGCNSTIEKLKNVGQAPKLRKLDPPVKWAQNYTDRKPNNKNSLWNSGSRAFFKDPHARMVGDIVKVKISIKDKAKVANKTKSSRSNADSMDQPVVFGLETQLSKFMEVPTGSKMLNLLGKRDIQGSGDINRQESIETQVAAMVTQILPNGNLIIAGNQEIRINHELREISVSGIVRPEDISAENEVSSEQIAEAKISYGGRGTISDVQQPRYGSQVMDILLPF